ncbi:MULTISPECIES: chorismate lyase [Methanobacterium]|uniref:UbiC family transcriptional regulator n=1 Tax=Methanobacterium bryantii TaxID=2161 RepID=A0A2A2H3T0_METBR|nr:MULTISPECIES: chorismate lyase [Methanobacterium]OEC84451.1 UbiC family transcriptional regulator [Methanobacterium sp. A39]PAV04081.1 UbiC family transcriptional regulator [Methanobacterium bryantii]
MNMNVMDRIKEVENDIGNLSSAQKILLATDGSVTTILDVLKGHINVETLVQEFKEADDAQSQDLGINKGDTINYRTVVMSHKPEEPLIHAISLTPVDKLTNNFKEDLLKADIPIGRILRKYNIESRREVTHIGFEDPDEELKSIFNTDSTMLTRVYNIIYKDEILIQIKETFPYSLFRE